MEAEGKTRERNIYKVTIIGGVVNFILVFFKFAAGILGQSAAMIADAVHSLSDFATDIVVLIFVRAGNKPRDHNHHYGHGKFETLATLIIGFVLLLVGIWIAYNGVLDVVAAARGKILPSPGKLALAAALISIIFKEILYRYTVAQGKKWNSNATIANAWHHRSDGLSSIGTAIGIGGAIFLGDRWTVLDPIAALVVSFFIVWVALKLMNPAVDELMEKSLSPETEQEIGRIVDSFEGVSDLHNLRTRKIGNSCAIEFHVRMEGDTSLEATHRVITEIENALRKRFGSGAHVIIHMEPRKG